MAAKARYWGKATFSVIFFLIVWLVNAAVAHETGTPAAIGFVSILWLFVATYSITGNVENIITTCKVALSIQALGAIIVAAALPSPKAYLLSLAVPTVAWIIMYFWASASASAATRAQSLNNLSPSQNPTGSVSLSGNLAINSRPELTTEPLSIPRIQTQPTQEGRVVESGSQHSKAMKVIEYSDSASSAWRNVQEMPKVCQMQFLDALEADPAQNAEQLANMIAEALKKRLRPYDDEAVNDALAEARAISPQAEAEFREVYELLGRIEPLDALARKVFAKHRKLTWQEYRKLEYDVLVGRFEDVLAVIQKLGYSYTATKFSSGGFITHPNKHATTFSNDTSLRVGLQKILNEIKDSGGVTG